MWDEYTYKEHESQMEVEKIVLASRSIAFEEPGGDWSAERKQIFLENTAVKLYVDGAVKSDLGSKS